MKKQTLLGLYYDDFVDEIELVKGASHQFNLDDFLNGKLTPSTLGPHWQILVLGRC